MTILVLTMLGALAASWLLTPLVRTAATRLGVVDCPDGQRKLHSRPIPLGGGVAIFLAGTCTLTAIAWLDPAWPGREADFLYWLLAAAGVLCVVGLIDDRWRLRGRQKLVGQVIAVGILMGSGLCIDSVQLFAWKLHLGTFAIPFTMFWLLGAINALNLIDGSDGVATTVGIVLSMALVALAMLTGHVADAIVAAALLGALCGFLRYNFPPASIFLGDTGSMLIGLMLGVLAIRSALKGPATVALAAPTALWAIPLFDVCMAILRRKLTGRSIYATDRSHLHHCLQQRGYSGRKTVFFIAFLCACTSVGAFISVYRQSEVMALISAVTVVATLIATRFFGHGEFRLLLGKTVAFVQSLIPSASRTRPKFAQHATHLQGTRQWEGLWQGLLRYADEGEFSSVRLNVSLPALHEEFHASWERNADMEPDRRWATTLPLRINGETVGSLELTGLWDDQFNCKHLADQVAGLSFFEYELEQLLKVTSSESAVKAWTTHRPVPAPAYENAGTGNLLPR